MGFVMPVEGVDAYPLYWAEGWTRTPAHSRQRSRYEVHFIKARDEILRQLKLLGGVRSDSIVISTNIPLRRDGLPLANMAEPQDPGVAVYWVTEKYDYSTGKTTKTTRVLACDKWQKVRDNLRAIGLTIDAMRAIDRAGASQILDRVFTGLTALPANAGVKPWRQVMQLSAMTQITWQQVEGAYRILAMERHPDRGGSHDLMQALNRAREDARKELGA